MAEENITPTNPAAASNAEPIQPAPAPIESDAPLNPEYETELERSRHALDTSVAPHSGEIGTDIAKILEEVKMPERRDVRGLADVKLPPSPVATAPAQPLKVPEPAPEPGQKASSIVTPLRTLKDDLQNIIRSRRITTVRAVALEQEKKKPQPPKIPEEILRNRRRSRQTFGLLFAIVGLLLLGCAALIGVYVISASRAAVPPLQSSSILFAESTVTLPLQNQSADALKETIAEAEATPAGAVGSIMQIVPTLNATSTSGAAQASTATPATLSQFFSALNFNPPQDLLRALGSQFFFGFYNDGQSTPVFVIPVTSYEQAFADMLTWEPTMDSDLAPIFPSVPALTTGSDGLPTERTFQDDVMRNYDVRELKDDSGNIVLYYSFPTPSILIIASSPYTFTEVLNRLQAARQL